MSVWALLICEIDAPHGERRSVRIDPEKPCTIGRSQSCDIVLGAPNISGLHAEVSLESGELRLVDKGSRNGTWVVAGDAEQRLEPGQFVKVGPDDIVRVGPFQLAPCELLSDDVVMSACALVDFTTRAANLSDTREASERPAQVLEALQVLHDALSSIEPGPDRAWRSVLEGLLHLADADRGFLLAPAADGFVLRAAKGSGTLSQQFIMRTAEQESAWDLTPVHDSEDSPSIRACGPGVTLTGIPLRHNGELIAVGYLERPAGIPFADFRARQAFLGVTGALLAMSEDVDREHRRSQALARRALETAGDEADQSPSLVGSDARFREAVETIKRAAGSRANILIRGPSGSGKEQLAQLAHGAGARAAHPFVVLNCAALPETLIESELFGVDRGAYTGADKNRPGAFAQAHRGTLFLDEIGDLPLAAQAKILRVIETGEVVRVGGSRDRVDVRLVTATHRDLEGMVRDGTFREDLYYRLRVIEARLPPLLERQGDILPLAEHFLDLLRRSTGRSVHGISVRAAHCLQRYDWPGNVRELRNVIDRALVLDRDDIVDVDDLPQELRQHPGDDLAPPDDSLEALLALSWPEAKERFEEHFFRIALGQHGGVQATAQAIGVDRRTMSTKIARHGLRDALD